MIIVLIGIKVWGGVVRRHKMKKLMAMFLMVGSLVMADPLDISGAEVREGADYAVLYKNVVTNPVKTLLYFRNYFEWSVSDLHVGKDYSTLILKYKTLTIDGLIFIDSDSILLIKSNPLVYSDPAEILKYVDVEELVLKHIESGKAGSK